jgi:hypothetical protein
MGADFVSGATKLVGAKPYRCCLPEKFFNRREPWKNAFPAKETARIAN